MANQGVIVGIDLGTTNSVIAVMEGAAPTIIPNLEGNRITPSCVAFLPSGEVLVGEAARRQAVVNPRRTLYSVKRFMGRRYRELRAEDKLVGYEVVGGRRGFAKVKVGEQEYAPPEIAAIVLRKLKQAAEAYLRQTVERAVIAVPAYFNDAQRQATKDAGEIAGFTVERIANEPTAASLAYGLDKKGRQKIAVVDFGGGTFDVSILELTDGMFQVLSTSGDTRLGGDDFDKALVNHVAEQFQREQGLDLRQDPMALQRLLDACETAKRELSTVTATDVTLPFITADQHGPKHLQVRIHRVEFEQLIGPHVERCCKPILNALNDAKLTPQDLNDVLLVGGSTRVPRVLEMLREMFGREPNRSINPDEAVAAGAAIQGDLIGGKSRSIVLLDVIPLSLGIETRGGFMTPIIERNTTIPTSRTEVFSTSENNQSTVIFRVFQGEREIASHNRLLDEFHLKGVRPAPAGIPQIKVTFDVDANSILHVSAEDVDSGQAQTVRIEGSSGLSAEDVERLRNESLEPSPQSHATSALDDLRHHAELMCQSLMDVIDRGTTGVDEGFVTAVRALIQHTRQLILDGSEAVLKAGMSELGRAGRDLATAIARARSTATGDGAAISPGGPCSGDAPTTGSGPTVSAGGGEDVIDVDYTVKDV